jgi:hypothetical protein
MGELVKLAAGARLSAVVAGMEDGDEFALPPSSLWGSPPNLLPSSLSNSVVTSFHEQAPALRWQIVTPVTSANAKANWGDTWFAQDLAEALRSLGQIVTIDSQSSAARASGALTDVRLTLRGRVPISVDYASTAPGMSAIGDGNLPPIEMAWLISNPEAIEPGEFEHLNAIFVASETFTKHLREQGVAAETLLQATNPKKFYPLSKSELSARVPELLRIRLRDSLLFVGGARKGSRPIVSDAKKVGAKLAVFGHGWGNQLPEEELLGERVANQDLAGLYQSAKVVLADHEETMRRNGFVANRIFDAAASGARVLTDQPSGGAFMMEDLFGSSVRTYHDLASFRGLVIDPETTWPADELRKEMALRIGKEHSFLNRAEVLLASAQRLIAGQARQPALL